MAKRSCAFSARANDRRSAERRALHGTAVSRLVLGLLTGGLLAGLAAAGVSPGAWAAAPEAAAAPPSPAPSLQPVPSPSPVFLSSEAALSLPAVDLESAPGSPGATPSSGTEAPLRVGDTLRLAVIGAPGAIASVEPLPSGDGGAPAPDQPQASPPGSREETLFDQGWEVDPKAEENTIRAIPLKAGRLDLPSLLLRDADGRPVARTNPFSATVQSAIAGDDPKPQEPVPAKPPVSLPFPRWVWLAAGAGALLLLAAIIYGVRRWLRRARPAPAPVPAPPPKTPDEAALEALAELEKQELMRRGNHKLHYFRVSEILKTYLGARYRFDALECTSAELLAELDRHKKLSDSWIDKLENLFGRLDLVKFTDHVPNGGDGLQVLEDSRYFVINTRRPPSILPPPDAAGSPPAAPQPGKAPGSEPGPGKGGR